MTQDSSDHGHIVASVLRVLTILAIRVGRSNTRRAQLAGSQLAIEHADIEARREKVRIQQ